MSKGIVMEKHRRYTIVMRKDGVFQKAFPLEESSIGDEVSFQPMKTKNRSRLVAGKNTTFPVRLIAMACMLLLLVMPFYFMMNTNTTYAYVNIDINPSIELEIDEKLHVKSIVPLNDDAKLLVSNLSNYKGDELQQVINQIMDESEKADLLKNGKNMLVGVSYISGSKEISVLDSIDRYFIAKESDWSIATFQVPKEVRKMAKEKKKSMNEIMAKNFESVKNADKNSEVENDGKTKPVNNEEEAIIKSFYNKNNHHFNSAEKGNKNKDKKNNSSPDPDINSTHPSELKGKNGEVNSNGSNKKNNRHDNKKDITKDKKNEKAKGHEKAKHTKQMHDKKEKPNNNKENKK